LTTLQFRIGTIDHFRQSGNGFRAKIDSIPIDRARRNRDRLPSNGKAWNRST
jgi:hypothetical protein